MHNWLRLGSIVILLLVWHTSAVYSQSDVLPDPFAVVSGLIEHTVSGELVYHMGITLRRVFFAFLISMLIGTVLGLIMGQGARMNAALDILLVLALNIPALVTIILCYVWLGLTETAAVTAVAINKIPTVAVTIREGARALDTRLIQVGYVYRVGWSKALRKIVLPQLYPYLIASARSGLALIWKIVLVVELLGRSNGVGFQLGIFFNFFDITSILAYTLAFALVIYILEALILQPLDTTISRWRN